MERFKLKFGEPRYYVNEKKKTVTCVMTCRLTGNPTVMEMLYVMSNLESPEAYDNIRYNFEVSATSKLYPGDTFDVETGKKVARAKAESQAYLNTSNRIGKLIGKYFNMVQNMYDEFYTKSESVVSHNDEYLEKF
jgi:hypothetical protein